jgi:hypothetical protein
MAALHRSLSAGTKPGRTLRCAESNGMRRLLVLTLLILQGTAARATVPGDHWWGVLVGVSHYAQLGEDLQLLGPANDVPLFMSWLAQQRVPRDHLTVLADQVHGANGLPTRRSILAALAALPDQMKSGDIAFLYFAGHGSQQPEGGAEWRKADGQDEIFLPSDIGRWDTKAGRVENAISGHEVGRAIDALRARGVFVWLVFDSCHSATMARASAVPGFRLRTASPERLGIPASAKTRVQPALTFTRSPVHLAGKALPGDYVAFYAAQTVEATPEMNLPLGDLERKPHGLFSYALLRSLSASGAASYREVSHRILAYYATTYPGVTPEFEGALDGPVGAPQMPLLSAGAWPAQRSEAAFHVEAGRLNGVTPGSMLALSMPLAINRGDDPVGLLRVERATLTEAWASVVTMPDQLAQWKIPADRTDRVGAGIVSMLDAAYDLTIRLAGPAACFPKYQGPLGCATGASAAETAAVETAQRLTRGSGGLPAGSVLSQDADHADLLLLVRGHLLHFLRPNSMPTDLDEAAAVDLTAEDAQLKAHDSLARSVRAVGLLRLAADFPGRPDGFESALMAGQDGNGALTLLPNHGGAMKVGDSLVVRLQNRGEADLDVTALVLDDRFGITPVYPTDRESNLLRRGTAPVDFPIWMRRPGRQQILFITEESRTGRPHDLSYLAQPGVSRQGAATKGFSALLERIGFAKPGSRASVSPAERQTSSIRIVSYEVRDRQ